MSRRRCWPPPGGGLCWSRCAGGMTPATRGTSLDVYQVNEADELTLYQGQLLTRMILPAPTGCSTSGTTEEGAAFAVNGMRCWNSREAFWAQDVEAALQTIQLRTSVGAAASALKPGERSVAELFAWRAERLSQSHRSGTALAALRWLSPDVCISLCEIRVTGHGGEAYRWSRFYVSEYRDGLSAAVREFDIDDEAEGSRMRSLCWRGHAPALWSATARAWLRTASSALCGL